MRGLLRLCALGVSVVAVAHADTVSSTAVIYAAGSQSSLAASVSGSVPGGIAIGSGVSYFTFSVSGTVVLNNGTGNNSNNADGFGAAVSQSSNTGFGSISGLVAPNAGYLTGVFIGPGGPSGAAPPALNFVTGSGTSFSTLSPQLDQAFFIGDGLTGNNTGSVQQFFVPAGATELYLAISDACGYNGSPSCYGDNLGSFTVDAIAVASTPSVPEPSSILLFGTGILGMVGAVRRRVQVR